MRRNARRNYGLAALAAGGLVVYGSLVPFRFTALSVQDALSRFSALPYFDIGAAGRADWVANILLFVPVGYLFLGALAAGARRPARLALAGLAVLACAAFSIGLEFTQLWFPPRTVSQNDIIAEALGGLAGALLWLAGGEAVTDWLQSAAASRRPRDRFAKLLELYLAGFLVYSALPLDLTISSGELVQKIREGRLILIPFSDVRLDAHGIYSLIRDVVVFMPIGMLLAVWRTRGVTRVRSPGMVAGLAAPLAAATELMQVFVFSRYANTTDVLLGTLGATAGGAFMAWLYAGRYGGDAVDRAAPAATRTLARAAATALWALVVAAVFCAPFDIAGTPPEWRTRYEGLWATPFARLYLGSEFNAISDVARKLLLFGLFGALAAWTVRSIRLPRRIELLLWAGAVGAGASLALAIEIAQVLLPPHVPDITDVILGGLGTAVGVLVLRALAAQPHRDPRQAGAEQQQ